MAWKQWQLAAVPRCHPLAFLLLGRAFAQVRQVFAEALADSVKIVVELVGQQQRLTVQFLQQLLQRIELGVMDVRNDVTVTDVHGAVRHLRELAVHRSGVGRRDHALGKLCDHVALHLVVELPRRRIHVDLNGIGDQRRQLHVIVSRHLQPVGRDPLDDPRFGTGQKLVIEAVVVKLKILIAVVRDVATERGAVVQHEHLTKQVHVAVGRQRSGQAPATWHLRQPRPKRLGAIRLAVFELREFVNRHHVERQRATEV